MLDPARTTEVVSTNRTVFTRRRLKYSDPKPVPCIAAYAASSKRHRRKHRGLPPPESYLELAHLGSQKCKACNRRGRNLTGGLPTVNSSRGHRCVLFQIKRTRASCTWHRLVAIGALGKRSDVQHITLYQAYRHNKRGTSASNVSGSTKHLLLKNLWRRHGPHDITGSLTFWYFPLPTAIHISESHNPVRYW